MVARIPLIVNPSVEQIQELPSGDSLSIPGDLDVTGTVTGSALHAVKLTADGTIAANAAVTLTSAGKAKAISTVAESHGTASTFLTHTDGLQVRAVDKLIWDAGQNVVLMRWSTNFNLGLSNKNMTAGVLSGSSITWNTTPTGFGTQYTPDFDVNGEGGGLAVYRISGTGDLFYQTFTLSGSTITMGTQSTLSAYVPAASGSSPDRMYCEYLRKEGSSHYFVVTYRTGYDAESGSGMQMIARIAKWDGQDNVTLGTEVQIGTTVLTNADRTKIWPRIIPLEDDRFLLYDSEDYHVCTREAGTTNFRLGVANANITGGIGEASHHPVYDPRTKYLITTDHTAWSVIYFWSVDGENINYRFKVTLPSGTGSGRVEITDKGQILYSYIDGAFGNGKQIIGTFNDARDDITWAAATTWSTNADNLDNQPRLVKTTDGKVVQAYYSGSGGNEDGKSVVSQMPSTTLTEDNFLGFSAAGYSDGNTASISILGSQSTQSGLTIGKKYYVQDDGTIGIGKSSFGVVAGKALSATKLLITEV
tara:strand:+ start:66 stop:1664 length:1599 start_codon:yes stop_codon:yes gene_type:complete